MTMVEELRYGCHPTEQGSFQWGFGAHGVFHMSVSLMKVFDF